jgi:hypothetical protein
MLKMLEQMEQNHKMLQMLFTAPTTTTMKTTGLDDRLFKKEEEAWGPIHDDLFSELVDR